MLFEVEDLEEASPATVSRCGIVYLSYLDLGWRPVVKSWIKTHFDKADEKYGFTIFDKQLKKELYEEFELHVDGALETIRGIGKAGRKGKMRELIQSVDLQLVRSLMNLLEAFLRPEYGYQKDAVYEDQQRYMRYCFAFAFIWSICASIEPTEK